VASARPPGSTAHRCAHAAPSRSATHGAPSTLGRDQVHARLETVMRTLAIGGHGILLFWAVSMQQCVV
jgi:hypothetical protein